MMLGFLSKRGVVAVTHTCARGLLLVAIVLVGLAIEPAKGAQFVDAASLPAQRARPAATLLPSSKVFAIGGTVLNSAITTQTYAASSGVAPHSADAVATVVEIVSDTPDPTDVLQAYDVSVHVSAVPPGAGTPTGGVWIGPTNDPFLCLASLDDLGNGSCSLVAEFVGDTTLVAFYEGDVDFAPSQSAPEPHTVRSIATATYLSQDGNFPSVTTEPVTFTVFIDTGGANGEPTGTVVIGDAGNTCTTAVVGNFATCTIAFDHAGEHMLQATYGGDDYFDASTSEVLPYQVFPAPTSLSIIAHAPDPSTPMQPVTVTVDAFVEPPGVGAPTGPILVTGSFGQQECTIAQSGGSCELTLAWRGPQELMAQYIGNEDFNVSFDFAQHRVNELPFVFGESYASNEDATLGVESFQGLLINDSDEDGDRLAVVNTGPQTATGIGGTVALNADGSFSYAPPPDAFGEAAFDYIVSDGYETVSASATLTVNPVNDPPSFTLAASPKWPANTSGDLITFSFATPVDFGPNENNSVLAWHVRIIDDPNGVLSGEVTIGGDGYLYYTLSGHGGVATLGVTLQDDGGTANGGNDTSPEQKFTITVGFGADLSAAIDDGTDFAIGGDPLLYMITVRNLGPDRVDGARVYETMAFNLVDATWVCTPSAGASCTANGTGSIEDYVNMPSGGTLVYELTATVLAIPEQPVYNSVSVSPPAGVTDFNVANDGAVDIDITGIFADGFDVIGDTVDDADEVTATRKQ